VFKKEISKVSLSHSDEENSMVIYSPYSSWNYLITLIITTGNVITVKTSSKKNVEVQSKGVLR
jgi:hypothetical protein